MKRILLAVFGIALVIGAFVLVRNQPKLPTQPATSPRPIWSSNSIN